MNAKTLKHNNLDAETLNAYAQQAINKGFKFEYFTTYNEQKYRWDKELTEKPIKDTYFGFTADGNIWFWFRTNMQEDFYSSVQNYIFFQHRFNGATGKYIKSIKQKWTAKYLLGLQDWK